MTDEIDPHHLGDDMHVDTYLDIKHSQPRYICPYGCNKLIATRTIDYHKNNGCGRRLNDNIPTHPELKKRFYCCGSCLAEFVSRSEFHNHLRLEHDVHPEIHSLEFSDRTTFDRFKCWLESEGGAHFRHKSGAKRRGRGKGIFLACNRSGNVGSDKQAGDRTGPFRLGFTCTAYIHATEHADGHVSAEVCGDHYGHDARMRLPNVVKYIIAHKQIERCPPIDIIAYLRHHFLPYANENIYAQRVCFVDVDELRGIQVSCTKKWERDGIPNSMEIWEEELLDKVGIEWPPSHHGGRRRYRKPTTAEIAHQESWPRPRVFIAKNRREDGVLVPFDIPGGLAEETSNQDDYGQEMVDESRYIEMEMGDYEDDGGYVQEAQMVVEEEGVVVQQDFQRHHDILDKREQIIEDGDVEVEVESEVVIASTEENPMIREEKADVQEHVAIDSPTNEIVVVDEDVDEEIQEQMHHHHQHHHQHEHHQHSSERLQHHEADQPGSSRMEPRYIEVSKAEHLEQLMEEIDAFKLTILKRAEHTSTGNLKALLVRFQSLHHSIMDKDQIQASNSTITVFPNRAKYPYRPGKGLEKTEQEYLNRATGDVTLQPIEDEISDDEELLIAGRSVLNYNAGIWS